MEYYSEDFSVGLAHHGIKGQRWGVRRFQNADGTLTPQGRQRYGYLEQRIKSGNYSSSEAKEYRALRKANSASRKISGTQRMAALNEYAARNSTGLSKRVYDTNARYYNKKARRQAAKATGDKPEKTPKKTTRERLNETNSKVNDFRDRNASDTMKRARREDINKLSNKELQDYNTRLNLEKNYKNLTKRDDAIANGKKYVSNTTMTIATGIITGLAIEAGKSAIKKSLHI